MDDRIRCLHCRHRFGDHLDGKVCGWLECACQGFQPMRPKTTEEKAALVDQLHSAAKAIRDADAEWASYLRRHEMANALVSETRAARAAHDDALRALSEEYVDD